MRPDIDAARSELLELQGLEAYRTLRAAGKRAAAVLVSGLDGPDRDRAARDILDRIGVNPRIGLELGRRETDLDSLENW